MSDYGDDGYDDGGDDYYGDEGDDYDDGGDDYNDGDEDDYDDEDEEVDVYGDGDDDYEDEESYPKEKYQKDIKEFKKQYKNEEDNKYLGKKINRDIEESNNLNENDEDEGEEEEEEGEDGSDEGDEEQDSYDFNCETGDIGEKIVYDELKNNKSSGKINWMNKKEESYLPYDFKIKKGNKTIYIDAKSTVYEKGEDPMPVITPNEQVFIDKLKPNERYYIARVFDARSENPKITYYDAKTMEKVPKSKVMK